jgi:hypothetical protein
MDRRATDFAITEFAVRPDLLRRAVAKHQAWIEGQLGAPLSEAVVLQSDLDLAQLGVELVLGMRQSSPIPCSPMKRLRPFVLSATVPPESPVVCEITKAPQTGNMSAFLNGHSAPQNFSLTWGDCPLALQISRIEREFVAIVLNVCGC